MQPGITATISGWGKITDSSESFSFYPDAPMKLDVPVTTTAQCRVAWKLSAVNHPGMVCAGPVGGDFQGVCNADSGGPLFVMDRGGNKVVGGIASFGNGCSSPSVPGVCKSTHPRQNPAAVMTPMS